MRKEFYDELLKCLGPGEETSINENEGASFDSKLLDSAPGGNVNLTIKNYK